MSIHHSKGLEFPVVFLCDTAKKFNTQDLHSNMLLHSQLGFACCARDFVTRKQYPTVPMEALRLELERSMLSEEMRILYVALTRAKEKLVITAVQNDLEKKLSGFAGALAENDRVSPYVARSAQSYADWMLMALQYHPDWHKLCADLGCSSEQTICFPACRFVPVVAAVDDSTQEQQGEQLQFTAAASRELMQQLKQLCTDSYPDRQASSLVTKLSVSQVVGHAGQSRPFATEPSFLKKQEQLSGAQKGTAMHTFICCADHAQAQRQLEEEIARLVERRYLTAQQAKSLDREAIRAYYRSELFERIEKSARVRREFAFQAQLGAEQLQTVLPNIGKHRVTVQGIADLIFEEADGWTLVDFKTDRVADASQLIQRYREQLELYAQMLSKTNGIPICRKVIYSLFLHREIEVE